MRARRKRQLNYKKYLKQVKKVEDWGGGGSIACSKDKPLVLVPNKLIYQLKFSFCYANLTDFLRGDSQQNL